MVYNNIWFELAPLLISSVEMSSSYLSRAFVVNSCSERACVEARYLVQFSEHARQNARPIEQPRASSLEPRPGHLYIIFLTKETSLQNDLRHRCRVVASRRVAINSFKNRPATDPQQIKTITRQYGTMECKTYNFHSGICSKYPIDGINI